MDPATAAGAGVTLIGVLTFLVCWLWETHGR